jgi:outer membrane receptor protein involved in Fe transport
MKFVLGVSLLSTTCWVELAMAADASDDQGLPEIIVTAQKYKSTVQDTPISLTAVSGQQLAAAGITSVEELTREVPGLSMRSAGPGQTEYEARGLASNGGAAPTVGFYLDEVPLSPPAAAQVGKVVIDPNLYDINRIEVLRGPQGTLYGSGSMGGTVKVITNQPKLNTWEGSFQGTLSDTQGGSGNGGGNFMLNIPLGDTLALRLIGTDTYRSGWIDRIVVSPFPADTLTRGNVLAAPVQSIAHDVNTEKLYGGRASLLFQPNEDLSIVATALYQRMVMGGYDEFDQPPGPAYMAHYEAFPIPEPISDTVHIYSLTMTDNLGFADLTSATAYWDRQEGQTQDASESYSYIVPLSAYASIPYSEIDLSRQFSEEIRLTSRGDKHQRLHWVVGGFYSDLHSDWIEFGENPVFTALSSPPSDNPQGIIFNGDNKYRIRQYAAFADGSFNITDTLKFSTGLRWYRYLSSQFDYPYINNLAYGYYAPSLLSPAVAPGTVASDRGFNPRFNLSYSPNSDLTTYVSASKGFRPGGANQVVASFCGAAPASYGPDSVWDYELGEKAKMFGNWLTINSDIYYIKWTGVQQTQLLACGYEYGANAGNGRSFGPELEVNAKLSPEWSLSASATYTDAKITSPTTAFATQVAGAFSSCPSASNCTIPILNVPKSTASLALVYSTKVLSDYQLTARLSDTYVGSSTDESYYYVTLPSYNLANARLGLSTEKWSANLFVNNLTNKVAWMTANNTSFQVNIPGLQRISTNQPRTFGTEINYRF